MTIRYRLNSSVISLSLLLMSIAYFATFITMDVLSRAENIYSYQFQAINILLKADKNIQASNRLLARRIFETSGEITEITQLLNTAKQNITVFDNLYGELLPDKRELEQFHINFKSLVTTNNQILESISENRIEHAKELLSDNYKKSFENMRKYHDILIKIIQDQADSNYHGVRNYGKNLFIIYHILAASGALLGLFIIISITMYVIRPIKNLSTQVEELASGEGDLTKTIPISGKDEMASLAGSLNKFLNKTKKILIALDTSIGDANSVKDGTISSISENSAATTEISSNLQSIVGQISSLDDQVGEAESSIERLNNSVNRYENQIYDQVAIVEQTTASVTRMISSITNLSNIAKGRQKGTKELIKKIDEGDVNVQKSTSSVQDINADVDTILELVNMISGIAKQTNLLAMNAAIEAAHAGEAGKGFAVVADEIRKLAETSSNQSTSISSVLSKTVNNINKAAAATSFTQSIYEEIKSEFNILLEAFSEMTRNSSELDISGKQILETMVQLNSRTQQIKDESNELKITNSEMVSVISNLSEISFSINSSIKEINIGMVNITDGIEEMKSFSDDLDQSMTFAKGHINRFKLSVNVL